MFFKLTKDFAQVYLLFLKGELFNLEKSSYDLL